MGNCCGLCSHHRLKEAMHHEVRHHDGGHHAPIHHEKPPHHGGQFLYN